jgi:hypothetical protein
MHELSCVVHLHSLYSDGTGTVPEIARAARKAEVDVVLLTDHDTLEAKRQGEERWHGDVLVLVGEEVSPLGHNHYLAFGIDDEIRHGGMSPREICEAVRAAGGFGLAAHPWSKGSDRFKRAGTGMPFGDLDAVDGLELWSFVTDTAERIGSIPEALRFAATPDRVIDHPPERNLREWDRLCARRRVPAIGGLDAHQFGKRVGPVVLRAMGYARSFRQLRTHVLCEEPPSGDLEHDRAQVYDALREGRCFLAVDAHAPAHGFRFWAEGDGGEVAMGAEAPAGRRKLHAVLPAPARLRMLRDGEVIAEREAPALVVDADRPGVYRVEARLNRHGRERTWVISNPIYFR